MLNLNTILLIVNMLLQSAAATSLLRGARDLSGVDSAICTLDIEIGCTVHGDGMSEQDCASFVVPLLTTNVCEHTPLTTTMLYNGGSCEQSDHQQLLGFDCQDGSTSPPSEEGEQSYIVVTDAMDKDIIYHEDWVTVGMEYLLDARGRFLQDGITIKIYDSDARDHLLQTVVYAKSVCSSPEEMLSRFGASQIVSYYNREQGIISPFGTFQYKATLHLSVILLDDADINSTTLEHLNLLTSFAGYITLDELISNKQVQKGLPVTVSIPAEFDMVEKQTHSVLSQVDASGGCSGVQFHKFHTGGTQQF